MTKTLTLLMMLVMLSFSMKAQTVKVLTLDDAIKAGVDNSKQLKLSMSKANAASEKYKEYETSLYPSLKASAGYTRLSPIDPFTFQFPGSNKSYTLFPVYLNSYSSQVAAYEPIFTGLRAKYTLLSQQYLEEAAKYDVEKDKSDVVFNIINSYYNVYKIMVSLNILDENIQQINEHVKETKDYERQGLAIHNDILKVELQLSNAEYSKMDLKNSYEVSIYNLGILLGMSPGSKINIDTNTITSFNAIQVKSMDDYIKEALNNRSDIKASDSRTKASETNVEVAKGAARPQLGVGADFYYSNPNQRIIPPEDKFNATWDAGIYLSYDISSLYTNKHKVNQAKIQLEQSKTTADLLQDNIRMEVNQSYTTYKQSLEKIELSKKSIVQAEENYSIMHSRYNNHVALLSDLLDANLALLQAKMNLALSIADSEVTYYKLMKAVGISK